MSAKLQKLSQSLVDVFGDRISAPVTALGEVTIEVSASDYADVMRALRDGRAGIGPRMGAGDEGPRDSRLVRARA